MTRVYLIRHAEAEGNLYRRIHGQYDSLVTKRGERQIDALAGRFKNIGIDALYSSDLTRARKTAEAITRHHKLELHPTAQLREIGMGVWEDRTWGDIQLESPELLMQFSSDPGGWAVEGSESFKALSDRIRSSVCGFAAEHDNETIAIVSHGTAIRSLLCGAMGVAASEIRRVPHGDNTSVAFLEIEGGKINVIDFNNTDHLTEEISTFAKQHWWKGNSGGDNNNLRFAPLDLDAERDFYLRCYADAWVSSHGLLDGFDPAAYISAAESHVMAHDRALMKVLSGELPVGLVELDTQRDAEEGTGRISLFYTLPEFRGRGLSVQMIGHAVSVYRGLGREALRLTVSERNERAVNFYEHYGFKRRNGDRAERGRQLVFEMEI